jgi:hypothetical protein
MRASFNSSTHILSLRDNSFRETTIAGVKREVKISESHVWDRIYFLPYNNESKAESTDYRISDFTFP